MQRVCFLLKVREDRMAEYRRRHAEVWPDMLRALSETGWHNYSLFLRDDGLLVGYLETEDFEAAREAMARTEVNARWQADMAGFFEHPEEPAGSTGTAPGGGAPGGGAPAGTAPDEAMRPLTEIFHLA